MFTLKHTFENIKTLIDQFEHKLSVNQMRLIDDNVLLMINAHINQAFTEIETIYLKQPILNFNPISTLETNHLILETDVNLNKSNFEHNIPIADVQCLTLSDLQPTQCLTLTNLQPTQTSIVPRTVKIVCKDPMIDSKLTIDEIYNLLLSFQVPHVKHLVSVLEKFPSALDSSDTGCGKTHVALAICAILKLKLFLVGPKSVISTWRKVAKIYRVEVLGLSNYESIKTCKYYTHEGLRETCPYIKTINGRQDFQWILPNDVLLIFDEVHKCKNLKSKNSKLLTAAKTGLQKVLMLSATVADRPHYFANVAYMLDICKSVRIFPIYLKSLKMSHPQTSVMMALNQKIFPQRGSRLRIADLDGIFPRNQVIAETYQMDENIERQIQEQYEMLNVALQDVKKKEMDSKCYLELMIRVRQKTEILKVKSLIELAEEFLENNFSVVIFVNFRETLALLENHLQTGCLIHGDQTMAERDLAIESFQNNSKRILIATIQSGGVAISLHDIHGGHPRASLIMPTYSSSDLVQSLGRIFRANGKTPCFQRIVFCANTIEEDICENLQVKINNYSMINDNIEKSQLQLTK